jgi:anti-sigma regulatory factor (Ser/Thr protein kinase)
MDHHRRVERPASTTVEVPPQPDAAGTARRFLEPIARPLDGDVVDTAKLLVTEVIANAVVHGDPERTDPLRIRMERRNGTLRVQVNDCSRAFEPNVPEPTPGRQSGWGMFLIDELADRWGVQPSRDGVSVWFEIDAS